MSPRLDTPLDRREAVSALLVMLAAVMGLGALPEPVEAHEPISVEGRLNGVFVGFANRQQSSTRLRLFVEDGEVWAQASGLGADDAEPAHVLTPRSPEVLQFLSELIGLFPVEPDEDADTE